MRLVLCTAGGLAIIIAAGVDLLWTTLGTHGGGPISGPLTARLWFAAVALHRRRPHHKLLSFVGSAMLAFIVVFWMMLFWLGAFVVFSGNPASVADSLTHRAVSPEERWYFTGATLFTFGSGLYQPNGPLWRLATVFTGAIGLGSITLAITFILQVLSSVVLTRSLAAYISDVGGSPMEILSRSWTGEKFEGMDGHMSSMTTMLHAITEQHLAYPIVHYFHSEKLRTATSVRLASLFETMMLLETGVARHLRVSRISILPLIDALVGFCEVIGGSFVPSPRNVPPPPPLQPLRDLGVETVGDAELIAELERFAYARRFFLGLVEDDGWKWVDVFRREGRR